jgi:hypothetical protein
VLLVSLGLIVSTQAQALQRFAVLVGANKGWAQDRTLRHAVGDARKLAGVLEQMGGFSREDIVLLEEPTTEELRRTLDQVAARTAGTAGESLFLFYYSGHADQEFLHLRGAPLGLKALAQRIEALPLLLKLGILDACQSGAFLTKGGKPARPFALETPRALALRGLVFLSSSREEELSQEAQGLGGSIFSHHLASGLRGAADENGDGQVSLDEVYRYAYTRTREDTDRSPHGPQHPQKRFDLRGQGEVILTQLEEASARVRFPPSHKRCFIDDEAGGRLAEVPARPREVTWLGLEAGGYQLRCAADGQEEVAVRFVVASGVRAEVSGLVLAEAPRAPGARVSVTSTQVRRGTLKHRAFMLLAQGQPEEALQLFERSLREDRRDQQAFEGKSWSLLAMADEEWKRGRPQNAARLEAAALMAWPSIEAELRTRSRERMSAPTHTREK